MFSAGGAMPSRLDPGTYESVIWDLQLILTRKHDSNSGNFAYGSVTHALRCTHTHTHRRHQTHADEFVFATLDPVPYAPHQHLAGFLWWCVSKCTSQTWPLSSPYTCLTYTLLTLSHCRRFVQPDERTRPYCSANPTSHSHTHTRKHSRTHARTHATSAFFPRSRVELANAVNTCLRLLPKGACSHVPHGPIGEWDVSRVTDMTRVFSNAKLFRGDISKCGGHRVRVRVSEKCRMSGRKRRGRGAW